MKIEQAKMIAGEAWKSAANAYRMYPGQKHTFSDYWDNYGSKLKINVEEPAPPVHQEQGAQEETLLFAEFCGSGFWFNSGDSDLWESFTEGEQFEVNGHMQFRFTTQELYKVFKSLSKRDYSKFYTPPHIAKYMVSLVNINIGDVLLEPSAGNGAIVREIKNNNAGCKVFAFEINPDCQTLLRNSGADVVVIKDFLAIPVHAKFNHCIANPPFGNNINLDDHFNHIRSHVKDGGAVVMIVPEDFIPEVKHETHQIENWSKNKDGSTTKIKIIKFYN